MKHSAIQINSIDLYNLYLLRGKVFPSDSTDGLVHLEQDYEKSTIHLGVFILGRAVAGGSLVRENLEDEPAFRIRAVAVSPEHQDKGFGSLLVKALLAEAQQANHIKTVWLSSLTSQVGFYLKLGFNPVGAPYLRPVDGWSQVMIKKLA